MNGKLQYLLIGQRLGKFYQTVYGQPNRFRIDLLRALDGIVIGPIKGIKMFSLKIFDFSPLIPTMLNRKERERSG
jgi:hypothetical protein